MCPAGGALVGWHEGGLPTTAGGPFVGVLASAVFEPNATQHVFYSGLDDGHQREISWPGGGPATTRDLTSLSGAPPVGSQAFAAHVSPAEGVLNLFYVSDQRVYQLWWKPGERPGVGDLTAQSGGPPAVGTLTSHFVTSEGTDHVFYTAPNGHVIELWWRGGDPARAQDLTVESGNAPLPGSDLHSHVVGLDGSQHVFYIASGHLIEIAWTGGGSRTWRDLNVAGGHAPLLTNSPVGHVVVLDWSQHVFAIAEDQHVFEFAWGGEQNPTVRDRTDEAGAPVRLAYVNLASHEYAAEGTQHVFFRDPDAHIVELWWPAGGAASQNDLTETVHAPLAVPGIGGPVSHVLLAEETQHVFYASSGSRITELWYSR